MTNDQICRAQRNKDRVVRWAEGQLQSPSLGRRRLARAMLDSAGVMPPEAWLGTGEGGRPIARPAGDPYREENPAGLRVTGGPT